MDTCKNVLLLLVDCLRADRCQGAARKRLRFIDYLCKNGTYFSQAISVTSFTSPSVASFLTGVYPFRHGIESFRDKLNPEYVTLAEILRDAGYTTCAMVTGTLFPHHGLNRGFDHYQRREVDENLYSGFKNQLKSYLEKLRKPWFMFVHLWELHYPVYLPKHLEKKYAFSPNKYDIALNIIDRHLSTLLSGIMDQAIVVLVSDHGERLPTFFESIQRNLLSFLTRRARYKVFYKLSKQIFERFPSLRKIQGHGFHLYDSLIRVPLIFAGNEFPKNKIFKEQVTQLDIFPTIIDAIGLARKIPGYVQGRSLMPLMNGETFPERYIYIGPAGLYSRRNEWLEGLRTSKWKYVSIYNRPNPVGLYDLENDPDELNNLVAFEKEIVERFEKELRKIKSSFKYRSTMTEAEQKKIRERLRTLGYLD